MSQIKEASTAYEEKQGYEGELYADQQPDQVVVKPLADTNKTKWQRRSAIFACGAGLFSDGYLNGIISSVNSVLGTIYGDKYTNSSAISNVSSIAFAGQVVGILIFGYTSDHWSRKWSLFVSTIILLIFAILCTGAYGLNGSPYGLFAALTAYRFFLGIGIGGEYPAGSVAAAENTGELESGKRNRWFVWFSNLAIDVAFVVASIVATIVIKACGTNLGAAWRIMFGIGCIPPLSLIYMRYKLEEPEAFKRGSMAKTKTPWTLVLKLYWKRLLVVSAIWFIYDFSAYAFGNYFTIITDNVLGNKSSSLLYSNAWSILMNFLYIPGAVIGSFATDKLGPRKTLAYGVFAQAIVGFIMAGVYKYLAVPGNVAGFVIVYGIFLSLGEFGPGDNIGLICAKTSATGIRGQYYAIAAASGKIGAFVGTKVFPYLAAAGGKNAVASAQYPFWLASGMAVISAALAFWGLPEITQDVLDTEELRFRKYLAENGYDVSKLGLDGYRDSSDDESVNVQEVATKY